MAELSKTESGLVTYFLDQLYVVKSKIQQLEKGGKEMKLALSSCERQLYVMKPKVQLLEKGKKEMKTALTSCERRIKVVENRKYMFFFSKYHRKIKQNCLYDIKQNLYLYNK